MLCEWCTELSQPSAPPSCGVRSSNSQTLGLQNIKFLYVCKLTWCRGPETYPQGASNPLWQFTGGTSISIGCDSLITHRQWSPLITHRQWSPILHGVNASRHHWKDSMRGMLHHVPRAYIRVKCRKMVLKIVSSLIKCVGGCEWRPLTLPFWCLLESNKVCVPEGLPAL